MHCVDKTTQFLQEITVWKKLLYCFSQENSFLKTQLSKAVDKENNRSFIANAELFQNEFILTDDFMITIIRDIRAQEKNLLLLQKLKAEPEEMVCKHQAKLGSDIECVEKEFTGLKLRFEKYLQPV